MKKLVGTKIVERYEYSCDLCDVVTKDKEFDLLVDFNFGYGSPLDGDKGTTVFCHSCSEKVLLVLKSNFPEVSFIQPNDYNENG